MNLFVNLLIIGAGGFLGAIARYLLGGAAHALIPRETFPFGTLVVNVVGCLIIGALMYLFDERQLFGQRTLFFAVTGFLGALTTFSAFSYETMSLVDDHKWGLALLNVGASLFLCLGAVILGRAGARLLGI